MHFHNSRDLNTPACPCVDNKAPTFESPLVHSQVSELPILPSLENKEDKRISVFLIQLLLVMSK